MQQITDTSIKQEGLRVLKIQGVYKTNRRHQKLVPEIKLSGKWLNDLGFSPEQHVKITTGKNQIVIELIE